MTMSIQTRAATFDALVARYERHGWVVRIRDQAALRAFVRLAAAVVDQPDAGAPAIRAPARCPACRKLWIDVEGRAIETDVPC